jgi:hypothetical protein
MMKLIGTYTPEVGGVFLASTLWGEVQHWNLPFHVWENDMVQTCRHIASGFNQATLLNGFIVRRDWAGNVEIYH